MAVTSIWRVKGWLGKVVIYIENPEKTTNPKFYKSDAVTDRQCQGLEDVISYAIDIHNVLNSNVAMMNLDELLEKAKTYFTHSTFAQFDTLMMFDPVSKDVICNLDICDISYNLARIRVPDSDANYYYVPSLSFYGNVHFICKETGDTYYYNEHLMLLTINAIDGTIINSTNR